MLTRRSLVAAGLLAPVLAPAAARAQTPASGLVRIINPFAAGGTSDAMARLLQPSLQQRQGSTIIVENRPGASASIGASIVAKSPPDGTTWLLTSDTFVVSTLLLNNLPYDVQKDFEPVTMIARGPIPIDEAMRIAMQLAEALAAAHERGVVHRDFKPANIKIREDGTVKVLDFGLAKAVDPVGGAADTMDSPAPGEPPTESGVILGTGAYMSPEQARGRPIDKRTDIWAFGCVLFEMLTGRAPFGGDTMSDILVAILEREPDQTILPADTPLPIRRLLRRCLEKDRKRRLDSLSAARLEIEDAIAPPAAETLARGARGRTVWRRSRARRGRTPRSRDRRAPRSRWSGTRPRRRARAARNRRGRAG